MGNQRERYNRGSGELGVVAANDVEINNPADIQMETVGNDSVDVLPLIENVKCFLAGRGGEFRVGVPAHATRKLLVIDGDKRYSVAGAVLVEPMEGGGVKLLPAVRATEEREVWVTFRRLNERGTTLTLDKRVGHERDGGMARVVADNLVERLNVANAALENTEYAGRLPKVVAQVRQRWMDVGGEHRESDMVIYEVRKTRSVGELLDQIATTHDRLRPEELLIHGVGDLFGLLKVLHRNRIYHGDLGHRRQGGAANWKIDVDGKVELTGWWRRQDVNTDEWPDEIRAHEERKDLMGALSGIIGGIKAEIGAENPTYAKELMLKVIREAYKSYGIEERKVAEWETVVLGDTGSLVELPALAVDDGMEMMVAVNRRKELLDECAARIPGNYKNLLIDHLESEVR